MKATHIRTGKECTVLEYGKNRCFCNFGPIGNPFCWVLTSELKFIPADAPDTEADTGTMRAYAEKEVTPNPHELDQRELGTVLAALRYWQACLEKGYPSGLDMDDIATDGGTIEPLDVDEIDALCERINC